MKTFLEEMKTVTDELLTDTPFISVDLDVLEKNIYTIAKLAKEANVKLRPHTKTHKSPEIAKMQIEAGASGITVAKLGEAEVMFENGIDDILIAFPIIGKSKIKRFAKLFERANLTVSLDDFNVAKALNEVGEYYKRDVKIYVDIDTGLGRMGRIPEESISHIQNIANLPFISIEGIMSHTGHAYAGNSDEEVKRIAIEDAERLFSVKQRMEKENILINEISIGASATIRFLKEIPHFTEARPGMYVFNDRFVMGAGGAQVSDCAATVYATVISRPASDRLLIDAGSKTLAHDQFKGGGYGHIKGYENLTISKLSEEHGIVTVVGECDLQVGDVVEIIPNHICPVINLADEIYGFRNGAYEKTIPIKGRGKNR